MKDNSNLYFACSREKANPKQKRKVCNQFTCEIEHYNNYVHHNKDFSVWYLVKEVGIESGLYKVLSRLIKTEHCITWINLPWVFNILFIWCMYAFICLYYYVYVFWLGWWNRFQEILH